MSQPTPFAQELLERALPPDVAAQCHEERVVKRPLYLRPTSPEPSARALRRRALNEKKEKAKKRKALKPRPLSAAKKRSLGLLEIPKEQIKWSIYLPLHNLWLGYMRDILGVGDGRAAYVNPASAGPILVSADMHGALLEVVRSRCVSRVGLKGIVVRDSQFAFEIVTEGSALKLIPKEHTMFRFEIPVPSAEGSEPLKPLVFEILGQHFQHRAPDRANRKYKMHYMPDL
ncbi:ribonuclease-like protein P complex subunit Pop4 [Westerdykella ornata]|uniref:Ribonuclease P protein subunit n=1 Tax=Westerdykella ornata TaxID=318751 RepID=A0A6A6JB02_WESOR|nr:ribonuclease-like protein P complex subunit Pop4 [Westerdykella ornata]KAF2273592.1 ribonuclease-like protein P complex subunit Pop4 [Westerdykella ornata]